MSTSVLYIHLLRAGSSGENICFDPLGTHTRAFITDVRPKLFDGHWKENVGGGDFLQADNVKSIGKVSEKYRQQYRRTMSKVSAKSGQSRGQQMYEVEADNVQSRG